MFFVFIALGLGTLKVSHHPTKFGGHRHGDLGDKMVLVYHMIFQEHVIKGSFDFIDRSLLR